MDIRPRIVKERTLQLLGVGAYGMVVAAKAKVGGKAAFIAEKQFKDIKSYIREKKVRSLNREVIK